MSEPAIRFGVNFLPGPPADLVSWVRLAEERGFAIIGLADSPSVYRDPYVASTLCALNTTKARFGPRVINPLTRHPTVAAGAAATIEELAPGRTMLGIGTGFSATMNSGLRSASLATLREYVTAIRELLAHGEATYQGGACRLAWGNRPVPLYVAAAGPRTLRLAGEIADGVIVASGIAPEVIRASIAQIRAGALAAGRDPDSLDLWWFPVARLEDDTAAAKRALASSLAASGTQLSRYSSEAKLVPPELMPKLEQLRAHYRYEQHVRSGSENAALIEELGLLDYLADRFAFFGSAADCVRRLELAAEAGARQFWISVHFDDKAEFIREWSSRVMPAFA